MPGKRGNLEKRREHREVAYLPEEVSTHFNTFQKDYPVLGTSSSQFIVRALEYYMEQIEAHGVSPRGFPNLPAARAPTKASQGPQRRSA